MNATHAPRHLHRAFTGLELSAAAAALAFVVAFAVPAGHSIAIKSRVPAAGSDLARAIHFLKRSAAMTGSTAPYVSLQPASAVLRKSSFRVDEAANRVQHDLGHPTGSILFASLPAGAGMVITVWGLHSSACLGLANALSNSVDAIEIGQSGTSESPTAPSAPDLVPDTMTDHVVKTPFGAYNALAAADACPSFKEHNFMRFYIKA